MLNPKVYVLLSTYNGDKYLRQQVESILAQSQVDVELYIRDDGSKDTTVNILKKYSSLSNVHINISKNVGWKKSFTELMHKVDLEYNTYYAFADQDDIWKSEKLIEAVKLLSQDIPMVYHSNVSQMDGKLNYLGERFNSDFRPNSDFPNYFFDGYGVGSTMVFNSKLLELVKTYQPTEATNHDAMVVLLGNLFGKVVYDSRSFIQYRRHDSSATAFKTLGVSGKPSLFERYRRYKRGEKNQFSVRARQIVAGYKDRLPKEKLNFFKYVAFYQNNLFYKLVLLLNPKVRASGLRKTLQAKYRVLVSTL